MDEIGMFAVRLPEDVPLADVEAIGARLAASGGLVPAYTPPEIGLLSILALRYAHRLIRR